MPRVVGVEIPKNKRIDVALTYIYGVGKHNANIILKKANLDPELRADKLTDSDVRNIAGIISDLGIKVEGDARRIVTQNIKRMVAISTYRGMRHRRGLPVRGQSTHSNARTRKGPRKR